MNALRAALLLLLLSAGPALAQPTTGKVQPDRLALGTVYAGATVEASFMTYEAGTDPNVPLVVTAPKWLKVLKKETHAQQFGRGNDFVCGSVQLSLDTATAGERKGEVVVTLGKTTVKLPVSATVQKRRAGLVRVLVAETPFHRHSTSDGGMFKPWTDLARTASLDPTYLLLTRGRPVLRDLDLKKFDCVLLYGGAVVGLTPGDVKRLRAFAEGGGRVVVSANAFFVGTVKKANEVLAGYGLEMRDEEARAADRDGVIVGKDGLDRRLVTAGVSSAHFYRASPVAVTDPKLGRVLVKAVGVGRPGDGFVAMARAGKGQVVALGDSLWWAWISEQRARKTDNAKLLGWLLAPPVGAEPDPNP